MFVGRAAHGGRQWLINAAKYANANSSIHIVDARTCSSVPQSSAEKPDAQTGTKKKWEEWKRPVRPVRPAYNARELMAEYLQITVEDHKIRLFDENGKDVGVMMKSAAEAMAIDRCVD